MLGPIGPSNEKPPLQALDKWWEYVTWFRRLALSANMRKQRIDTIRLKLLKIAAKAVRSARYITFKLCSSCPYKNEFYETLSNIGKLNVQLE